MALIDTLRELFLIDQQVRGLESRMDGARKHVVGQQAKLEVLRRQYATVSEQLHKVQATEAGFENEANAFDDRITKLRDQMNSVKTNKEYSALLVEVNTIKADKTKVDDKAMELLTQVDSLKKQVEQFETQIAEVEKVKAVAEKELEARRAEVGQQLDEVKRQRAEAAAKVPADVLAVFDRLAESHDGEALAPITQNDPREMEYTCGGCYMSLPPEVVNRLYSTSDKLVRCTSCSRILYLEKSMKEAMGSK